MIFKWQIEEKGSWLLRNATANGTCLECHLEPIPAGYSQVSLGRGVSVGAHRLMWLFHKGEIPKGLLVMHSCDNRRCINIEHLSLGTHRDNAEDMFAKKRNKTGIRTDRQSASKIQQFKELRDKGYTYDAIADKLGVSRTTVREYLVGIYSKPVSAGDADSICD